MPEDMKWTRRDVLKTGAGAAALAMAPAAAAAAQGAVATTEATPPPAASNRRRTSLDHGWRFKLGDADNAAADFKFASDLETFAKALYAAPAAGLNFDDHAWQSVDLPHDWAVDLPFVANGDHSFAAHGSKPLGRAYPASSIGWYRRPLLVEPAAPQGGRRLRLEFDGVFRRAIVFFNNEYLGENFSGYAPFHFDISDLVRYDRPNVIAVRVDATEGEGWFYEGAGIYRHVWLTDTFAVHLDPAATAIRSTIAASGAATVTVAADVHNESDQPARCRVLTALIDADGHTAAEVRSAPIEIPPFSVAGVSAEAPLPSPRLWSLESPHLYRAESRLLLQNTVVDRLSVNFGVRSIRFDADKGFFLNGKAVKIKGTCNHQDHAGVGAALPDRLQSYRVERLLAMGSNAYRTSHNPPTPELLDACDRLGMLVMDETRMMSSSVEGLSQLERLVRRDRNHPCVILWSLGNEEPQQGTDVGARVVATMKRAVRELDPTRPVTVAMNGGWGRGVSAIVDVQGFNYGNGGGSAQTGPHIDAFHARFPRQPSFGSETASAVSTRGVYANDKARGYVSAYDVNFPSYALNAEGWWKIFAAREFLAGGFAWTGFDYRGEPSPYDWPCISSHFGIMDTCGFAKDSYYYYQAWWGNRPVLHLFPHWNWKGREGEPVEVWCHTNLPEVELFLNGKSLGRKAVEPAGHAQWQVPYASGWIEARGVDATGQQMTSRRETTGAAAALALAPDRARIAADGSDLSVVTAEVRDAQGRLVPDAADKIQFALAGPGRILGVGNGDPSCHEPDHATERSAFNGLAMVLVQSRAQAGEIRLTATAPGLASATVAIQTA